MTDAPSRDTRWGSVFQAGLLVVAFWWLATGLLFGIPSDPRLLQATAVSASLLGGSALALAILVRQDDSPRAAWLGFLAGGTMWAWAQAALYGGWLVGPGAAGDPLPASRLDQVIEVLHATAWSEIASIGVVAITGLLAIRARNRMPFWTVLLFYCAHQVARLNVFYGVANPGADLLPRHLHFLIQFFGPAVNSPLLPFSVALWAGIAVLLLRKGWRSSSLFERRTHLVLGVLAMLAAIEHLFLGLPGGLPLWGPFTRAGSGS